MLAERSDACRRMPHDRMLRDWASHEDDFGAAAWAHWCFVLAACGDTGEGPPVLAGSDAPAREASQAAGLASATRAGCPMLAPDTAAVPKTAALHGLNATDVNGDGRSDLLWRGPSGELSATLMNGSSVTSSIGIGSIPQGWTLAGTAGDFNADGTRTSSGGTITARLRSG